MLAAIKTLARKYRFAPRVDGSSLELANSPTAGEAQEARINRTGMVDTKVTYWDGQNFKLVTVATTKSEVEYLAGVTGGTAQASKGLVLDANRDITTGIRNLYSEGINTTTLAVGGYVSTDLQLGYSGGYKSITSKISSGGGVRDVFRRLSSTLITFGNSVDMMKLLTPNGTAGAKDGGDVLHRIGTSDYTIFDERNFDALVSAKTIIFQKSSDINTDYGHNIKVNVCSSNINFYGSFPTAVTSPEQPIESMFIYSGNSIKITGLLTFVVGYSVGTRWVDAALLDIPVGSDTVWHTLLDLGNHQFNIVVYKPVGAAGGAIHLYMNTVYTGGLQGFGFSGRMECLSYDDRV